MTNSPYILFNKSPEQLRRLGARGGKAHGRNLHARRAQLRLAPPAPPPWAAPRRETTAQAIARLEAQFPWLREAQRPARRNQPPSLGPTL